MTTKTRVTLRFKARGGKTDTVNFRRRMYAVLRRYTVEVLEGDRNECFADLTGRREFLKLEYQEIIDSILRDMRSEINALFSGYKIEASVYDELKSTSKLRKTDVSTYDELNQLFKGAMYVPIQERKRIIVKRRVKLTVPFIGKVS